ncbi:WD40/YVTN/BNR-like repeat-containing protein [Pseudomonas sp. NPDC090755]|uniref:WD40/YVTN/BNR-like repeat-containing protein n=1 Tax=Pseudomonas sp. NPDC090755 TaxID=3364481 RepID=UPI003839EBC2
MALQWARPLVAAAALHCLPLHAQATFIAPVDAPPLRSLQAYAAPLNAVTLAGQRLVSVGLRGNILYSDDQGNSWQQADTPASVDLTALYFIDAQRGWAVGHDGLVLHSRDGGRSWERQLDGRQLLALWQAATPAEDRQTAAPLDSMNFPLLDVWFENEHNGFIVGAFNLILHTKDGGKHWSFWSHRAENPQGLHLYGIRGTGTEVFAVGEQGLVLKLDRTQGRFNAVKTPYHGSYFNLIATPDLLLVIGLRGNAYRSTDGGGSWDKADTGTSASLAAGTVLADGSVMLVSMSGDLLRSRDQGNSFQPVRIPRPTPYFAVAPTGDGGLVLVGNRGVRVVR